jgi:hypothetical protein
MSEQQLEYTIKRNASGYVVSGPALLRPSAFDSETQAIALCRHLIAAKSGGGFIISPDGSRDFFQGSRHLISESFARAVGDSQT